jgi:hypothetical protein
MLHIACPLPTNNQNLDRNELARIRRQARKRGFRVVQDRCGGYSLIDVKVEPARPLLGCDHQQLWVIGQVLAVPLPEPPPRRRRMARLAEPTPIVEEAPASAQANHGQVSYERSFQQLIRLLQEQGGAR